MNRKTFTASLLVGCMLGISSLQPLMAAEEKTNPLPGIPSNTLELWGGKEGVHEWAKALFHFILLDTRIAPMFKEFGNPERQIFLNTQLETMVLGGPNEYQGASMVAAHADLNINMEQFNAVVEAAYNACERINLHYWTCNQVIAALAPFTDDIVTR
ncbi:MAG: group I truncated hemoglobin [Panacagrimonas sp.]